MTLFPCNECAKAIIQSGIRKTSNHELNQTIIMITHNMELAKAADRTIMIEDGKIR